MSALPATESSSVFTVSWSGQDDPGGSGIASYDVYASDNGGAYTLWQQDTSDTSALFLGANGDTYSFYSVATDNVGNVESKSPTAEATTQVVAPVVDTTTAISASENPAKLGDSVTFTATVTPAQSTNGTPTGSVQFLVDGVAAGSPVPLVFGTASFTTSALLVGSHTIEADFGGNGNFATSTSTALNQVVNPVAGQAGTTAAVTSSANPSVFGQSVTFTATISDTSGGVPTGSVEFFDGATDLGHGSSLSGSGNSATSTFTTSTLAAGIHLSISAVYTPTGNFAGSSGSLSQTVNTAALTITADNTSKTYGDTVTFAGTEFTTSGLVNGDSVASVSLSSTGAAATASVAGSPYFIVASNATGSGMDNYTISYVNGSLTVNPATLTITVNNDSKTYGTAKTFSGTAFTETGLVNSDTITSVTETSTGAAVPAPVGTDPIVPSDAAGSGLGNYTIGYVNGTLTVNPATLTITANNDSKTYGTLKSFNGTAFTETGLVNGDTITGVTETSIGAPVSAPVGTDPIVPSDAAGSGLGNYTIGYVNGTLTVNPATLTITANNDSKTYGTLKSFNGTAFTETGLVTANGDTITGVTETSIGAPVSAPVGTDPIVPSDAAGSGLGNYTIGYVNGTLTVNPATLTITANNDSKTYGTKSFNGTAFTETGLVNGDTITGVTETSTGAAVSATAGTDPIVPSAAAGNGLSNYTIGYVNGTLTVNAAPLTVIAANESMTYGGTVPALTYTYTGLVNGDLSATFSGGLATTATSSTRVGGYPITQGILAATGNYTIGTFNAGTLTVNAAPLTITPSAGQSMVYGGTVPALTYTASGFVNGDPASLLTGAGHDSHLDQRGRQLSVHAGLPDRRNELRAGPCSQPAHLRCHPSHAVCHRQSGNEGLRQRRPGIDLHGQWLPA